MVKTSLKATLFLVLSLFFGSLLIPLENTNISNASQIAPNNIQRNMMSRLLGKVDQKIVNLEQFREEHSPDVLLIKFKSSITKDKQKQLIGSDASFLYEYSLIPGLVACKFEKGIENGLLKLGNRSDVIEVIEPDLTVSLMNYSNRGSDPVCAEGELEDCNGNCFPADWLGDGICDDGAYSHNGELIYLNCDEFECDGGDCFCDDGLPYACCMPNQTCSDLTLTECNVIGGTLQAYTQCSDNETLCNWPESWGLEAIDSSQAWNISNGRNKVIVAVLDTGIDTDHIEFENLLWINENEIPNNGIDDDNNGVIDDVNGCGVDSETGNLLGDLIEDMQGHGTHVSGTVASESFGVLKNATIMAVNVIPGGAGSTSGIVAGIDYAVNNGAKVINMSLGGYGQSTIELMAIDAAMDLGVVTVVAAGNNNNDSCNYSPAFVPNAVTVGSLAQGATMDDLIRSYFSNWGPCNDLFAPGSEIVSASINGTWHVDSGTSMASPHVAGVATAIYDFALPYTYNEIDNPTGLTPRKIAESISMFLKITSDVDVVEDAMGSHNLALNFANAMELLVPCDGDLNRSGSVTVDDILVLIASWNTDSGDINFDGTTDVNDLLALIALWNQTCPFPNIAQEIKYGCCIPDTETCQDMTEEECFNLGGNILGSQCFEYACIEIEGCLPGELEDCNGNCFPEDWIGDGYCDDGEYDHNGVYIYLNCDEFECDGGDCVCDDGTP